MKTVLIYILSVALCFSQITAGTASLENKAVVAAPSTPPSGSGVIYIDSTSKNLSIKNDAGTVNHGVQTAAGVTHQFATAISDAGVVSQAQPIASDVSGLAASATDRHNKRF